MEGSVAAQNNSEASNPFLPRFVVRTSKELLVPKERGRLFDAPVEAHPGFRDHPVLVVLTVSVLLVIVLFLIVAAVDG